MISVPVFTLLLRRERFDPDNPASWIALAVIAVLTVAVFVKALTEDARQRADARPRRARHPTARAAPRHAVPHAAAPPEAREATVDPPPPPPPSSPPKAPSPTPDVSLAERAAENAIRAVTRDGQAVPDVAEVSRILSEHALPQDRRDALVSRIVIGEARRRLGAANAARRWSPKEDAEWRRYLAPWGVLDAYDKLAVIAGVDMRLLGALWAAEHQPLPTDEPAVPLAAGELCHVRAVGSWDEARANGRTATLLEGDVHLTNRQVLVVGWQGTKALALKEVIAVRHENDGVWLPSGRKRNPFIRFTAGAGAAETGSVLLAQLLGVSASRSAPARRHEAARDRLFYEAAEVCIAQQGGSTSVLQRRLRIDYAHAAELLDQLEVAGVLGPADGALPRPVLVGIADLHRLGENA